ncbi:MAG: hypothetical protein AAFR88_00995 [Pseudomonadota bacterium]
MFGCPIVGLALELGQQIPAIREEAKRIFDEIERHFIIIAADAAKATGDARDPAVTGSTLTQLMHGANASSRLAASPEPILDAARASLSLIGFPDTPILTEEPSS